MIKCDRGVVEIEGQRFVLKAELTTIIRALYSEKILSENEIEQCVKNSKITDEELNKRAGESIKHIKDLVDIVSAIVNDKKIDEEQLDRVIKEFGKE